MLKVYVLEIGSYSQRGVCGVFSTPEKAMAGYPHGTWRDSSWVSQGQTVREWTNDCGDTATVTEHVVDED